MRKGLVIAAATVLAGHLLGEELPKPVFYLPLDGSTTAAIAGGGRRPRLVGQEDVILMLAAMAKKDFGPGKVGLCYKVGDSPLVFRCAGNFRPDEGACSFWLNPEFQGDDKNLYCTFFGAADWGMLYKYLNQSSLTFGTAKPTRGIYYDCSAGGIDSWRPGQWHHVVVCWSRRENRRRLYVDGERKAAAPFPFHRPVTSGPLFIGSGCTLYPNYVAHAKMDEVAIWDRPLDGGAVRRLHALGMEGKPLWQVDDAEQGAPDDSRLTLFLPKTPRPPDRPPPPPPTPDTREAISLDGWWDFMPSQEVLTTLPKTGWGLARVPGYWVRRGDAIDPGGEAKGRWAGRALSDFSVGTYQRTFRAPAGWKGGNVFLHLDGVDGLAAVYLNGERLAWLSSWEPESYDIGSKLRFDGDNVLTVVLHAAADNNMAGVHDRVSLQHVPEAFVHDIVVRPSVDKGRVEFSCDVWRGGEPVDAAVQFEIVADGEPNRVLKRFDHRVGLGTADRSAPELSSQTQRVECSFVWKDAHLWTYDDPFLYRVRARLRVGDEVIDESLWHRFGFREFMRKGSGFLLNGKPTHLRGHQANLGWAVQMERVKQLKAAGMNCFELSGPIGHRWRSGRACNVEVYEEALDYADEHGLITVPILPAARFLKERIFDSDVADRYRRRVDKHIRRYGNHPSICMWYMNFNLAGYRWYHPPTKIDGTYKPTNDAFRSKERYSLEAERIVRTLDRRPLYHHACGNFGDMFTLNCYIGPTSPLQEREEWPSRWAEKRPFPLIACEHGLLLIPYWYRPRQFPLSVVYADEPIFDELTAKYLGRRAYGMITRELIDLYHLDKKRFRTRLDGLIAKHPGYQEVKSLFARYSLRAWRTYGVSGIIFNAISWDFTDDEDRVLPVMKALARYFGDTDLYIAGPKGDWPSKDHCFFSGETIRKQIVLLNDLTRDIDCTLAWRLVGAKGAVHASGQITAVAQAGTPTMLPIEFVAPGVGTRTDLDLVVEPKGGPFKTEKLALTVFPPARSATTSGKIVVFDPQGHTQRVLGRAGVAAEPLTAATDLSSVSLVVVGREAYGEAFVALAKRLKLEQAVAKGLNLLLFEQAPPGVLGLKLEEQSARRVFMAQPDHPVLAGLAASDFVDLRGRSDLIEPYPDAPPETEQKWPERYFKWGNRGVVATFVCTKSHYAPFTPILECGFDLVDSPLMEARVGRGRICLCQVDVTSRYGTDPVSTQLVNNLLCELSRRDGPPARSCACIGGSATEFLRRFGMVPRPFEASAPQLVFIGKEPLSLAQERAVRSAAQNGATVVFLPGASSCAAFGLTLRDAPFFIGRMKPDAFLRGLNDGDLYMKKVVTVPMVRAENGWRVLVEPGLLAGKALGKGGLLACTIDPDRLGNCRGRVKALRFWNVLLANLGAERPGFQPFMPGAMDLYEPNPWEKIPPFINW